MENLFKVAEVQLTYKTNVKPSERAKITSSKDAYNILKPIFEHNGSLEHKEYMYAIYLNRANKVLGVLLISEGGTSGTVADPKIIFQGALKLNASALIVAHNHPSGNLSPSNEDLILSKRLKDGGKLLEIQVLDSMILGIDNDYISMADDGLF